MEKLLFRKIELWVVAVLAVFAVLAMIGFGAIVLFTQQGGKKFGRLGEGDYCAWMVVALEVSFWFNFCWKLKRYHKLPLRISLTGSLVHPLEEY